jgi:hypothetical protein
MSAFAWSETFSAMLEQARAERVPVMALRPHHEFADEMDDIVVKNCDVHLEAMSDKSWWMGCSFPNGERVTFNFGIGKKPARLWVSVGEMPAEWRDWDELWEKAKQSHAAPPSSQLRSEEDR